MSQTELQNELRERLNYDELMNCMRCGFCLPSCPTYTQTKRNEAASPRGRIALMKGVVDGLIEPDQDFEEQLNLCLGCRACEPVCPPGVNYGHLLEEARDVIAKHKKFSWPVKILRYLVFQQLFPKKERLRYLHGFIWVYQQSGLQKIIQKSGVLKLFSKQLAHLESVLPEIPSLKQMKNRPVHIKSDQPVKKKVAFFSGCLMDTMFMKTNDATIELLKLAGCEVFIPSNQVCCGALHAHSGEKNQAKALAKQNIAAFETLDVDAIISNAGGCGALLIEYDQLLKDEPEWKERAKQFVTKVKDISELLIELDFDKRDLNLPTQTITYQDSCHLRNVMQTAEAPRKLLQAIKGVTYQEMNGADHCCGSAGVYNLVQQTMSMQILDDKFKQVKATNAQTIVTSNPGCLLQMKLGVKREGLDAEIDTVHIVDLLLKAAKS